jgi:hypothetical protein
MLTYSKKKKKKKSELKNLKNNACIRWLRIKEDLAHKKAVNYTNVTGVETLKNMYFKLDVNGRIM